MSRVEIDLIAHDRASRPIDNVGDAADRASGGLKGMGEEAKTVDSEITRLQASLAKLRTEINAAPDDKALRRQYNSDRRSLAFLERLKADAARAGARAGADFTDGFSDTLAVLPNQVRGAALVAGVTLGAVMAPVIGATIGGAVLGAVGAGGIIGGIALAAQSPQVQEAGAKLGGSLLGSFADAAEPFERPLLDAIGRLDAAGAAFAADRRKDFAALAPLLKPLTDGATGFAQALGPGFSRAVDAAKPAIRVIANELPRIGHAFSVALEEISDSSDGGVTALAHLIRVTEKLIITGGEAVAMAEDMYEGLNQVQYMVASTARDFYQFTSIVAPPARLLASMWGGLADDSAAAIAAMGRARDATDEWSGAMNGFADDTSDATTELREFSDAIDEAFGRQMAQDEALVRYREGLAKVKDELREGAKTLSVNSQEGLENRRALLSQLEAIEQLRVATVRNTNDTDAANNAYMAQVNALRAMAEKAGFSKTELDKLFGPYAGKIFATALDIQLNGVDQAIARLRELTKYMGDANIALSTLRHDDSRMPAISAEVRANTREGRAMGGSVRSGVTYRATEQGYELLLLGGNGHVFSNRETKAALAGGGMSEERLARAIVTAMSGMAVVDEQGHRIGRWEARRADIYSRGG